VALTDKQRRRCTGLWRIYREALEELVSDGRDAGEFDVTDPHLTTQMILDMVTGVWEWYSAEGEHTIDSIVQIYTEAAVRMCGAAPMAQRTRKTAARSSKRAR
jgi:hypothetical protein